MLVLGKVTSLNSFPIMLQKYSGFCWAESHWIRYYCSLPFPPHHFFFLILIFFQSLLSSCFQCRFQPWSSLPIAIHSWLIMVHLLYLRLCFNQNRFCPTVFNSDTIDCRPGQMCFSTCKVAISSLPPFGVCSFRSFPCLAFFSSSIYFFLLFSFSAVEHQVFCDNMKAIRAYLSMTLMREVIGIMYMTSTMQGDTEMVNLHLEALCEIIFHLFSQVPGDFPVLKLEQCFISPYYFALLGDYVHLTYPGVVMKIRVLLY